MDISYSGQPVCDANYDDSSLGETFPSIIEKWIFRIAVNQFVMPTMMIPA
jgi:hypothetical protein